MWNIMQTKILNRKKMGEGKKQQKEKI